MHLSAAVYGSQFANGSMSQDFNISITHIRYSPTLRMLNITEEIWLSKHRPWLTCKLIKYTILVK